MRKYKVTMWVPMTTIVDADSKDKTLTKAMDYNEWKQSEHTGEEEYKVRRIYGE